MSANAYSQIPSATEEGGPTPSADSGILVSPSSTSAESSTISASTSTVSDLFDNESETTQPLDLADVRKQDIWIPYSTVKELDALTLTFIEHMNRNHLELAEIVLQKILRTQSNLGVRNIPLLSMALARDARIIERRGDSALAQRFLATAASMSPDLSQIHLLRLRLAFYNQPLSIKAWSLPIVDYFRSRITGFRNQSNFAFDLLIVIFSALVLAIILFSSVQLAKYCRYVLFFVTRYSPDWLSRLHVALLFVLLLSAPLVLGIGWILPLGTVLIVLWAFQRDQERKTGAFCWTCLVAAPAILVVLGAFLAEKRSIDEDIISVLQDANSKAAHQRVVQYVQSKEGAKDVNAVVALAQAAWYEGRVDQAKSYYLEAVKLQPNRVGLINNLGRVLFFLRETEEAKNRFKEAMAYSSHAEPMLNYASLLLDEGKFEEAQAAIKTAGQVDLSRARAYGSLPASVSTADKLLLVTHSDHFAWEKMWTRDPASLWALGFSLFRESGNPQNPIVISVLLILFGIIGAVVSSKRKTIGIYTPCVKCGRPTQWVSSESHCDQCQSVFLRSTAVDPNKRRIKKERVQKYQKGILYIERFMSGMPGLAEVFSDRAVIGFLKLFVFLCALAGFLLAPLFDAGATSLGVQTKQYAQFLTGMALVLMIVFSVRKAFRT